MRWAHNGHERTFGLNTAFLIFCKTEKIDAGIYTCFANNSVGKKEKQLKLLVNCKYDSVTINDEATVNSALTLLLCHKLISLQDTTVYFHANLDWSKHLCKPFTFIECIQGACN